MLLWTWQSKGSETTYDSDLPHAPYLLRLVLHERPQSVQAPDSENSPRGNCDNGFCRTNPSECWPQYYFLPIIRKGANRWSRPSGILVCWASPTDWMPSASSISKFPLGCSWASTKFGWREMTSKEAKPYRRNLISSVLTPPWQPFQWGGISSRRRSTSKAEKKRRSWSRGRLVGRVMGQSLLVGKNPLVGCVVVVSTNWRILKGVFAPTL